MKKGMETSELVRIILVLILIVIIYLTVSSALKNVFG